MRIKVFQKALFSKLIKRGKVNTNKKLEAALFKYTKTDYSLDYSETSITNDLKDHNSIRSDVLLGLTYLILEDYNAERPNKYSVEDFQKLFAHLNKEDLLELGESKRESLDQMIQELVVGNREFEGIYLSEEWEIKGGNSKNIDNYTNFVQGNDSLRGSDHQIAEVSRETWFWKFYRRNRLRLTYIFGFLFIAPLFVIPIVSIGIYKALTFIQDPKKRRKRIALYSAMIMLSLGWIVFINYKLIDEFNNGSLFDSQEDFDTNPLGAGMVTIHNSNRDGDGKVIGLKRSTIAEVRDTIIVSVLVSNTTDEPIENIKIELSPRNSGYNKKHIFQGTIWGHKARLVRGSSSLVTYEHTRIRSLDSVFVQRNNGKSKLERLEEVEIFNLFNAGYTVNKLYPGNANFMTVNALYIVEREEPTSYFFHPDPFEKGIGTTSIQTAKGRADIFRVKIPDNGDSQFFDLIIDYQNITKVTLTDVKATLNFESLGNSKRAIISGNLITETYYDSQPDEAYLDNLPNSWKLEIVHGVLVSNHSDSCGEQYEVNRAINPQLITTRGVELPILDTKGINHINGYSGACSEGRIVVTFKITNTEIF